MILNKDFGEVLVDTSHEDLSKHGMKPYVRWGLLKETLAAACILESGILQKAKQTGKLYVWDPFCGTGSFLLESLMSALEQPVRSLDGHWPFQDWPIHQKEVFERFREEAEDFRKIKREIDVQLIGSDISIRAIETASKNMDFADVDSYQKLFQVNERQTINDPLIFAEHWPKSHGSSEVINFSESRRRAFLSLYHGDFSIIGTRLKLLTNNFEDFTLLMNVPYGHQSQEKQHKDVRDTQNMYRNLGRFLRTIPVKQENDTPVQSVEEAINISSESDALQTTVKQNGPDVFVLAKARHYGHELSFEKFSNCGWRNQLHFSNGGLSVNLLKLDPTKLNKTRHTLAAYQSVAGKEIGSAADQKTPLLN